MGKTTCKPSARDYFRAMARSALAALHCQAICERTTRLPELAPLSDQTCGGGACSDRRAWRFIRRDAAGLAWALDMTSQVMADFVPRGGPNNPEAWHAWQELQDQARDGVMPSAEDVEAFVSLLTGPSGPNANR